jgi:methyltransferase (TIGR00027 family)
MSRWRNSTTANWIAAGRARESARPDALFVDSYAGALAGAEGFAMLERQERVSGVSAFIPVRTRFVDDLVLSFAKRLNAAQVVLLGAGLDTRAFRLGLPADLQWFELDREEVFEAKEPKLIELGATPKCHRHIVRTDLREDWTPALHEATFDANRSTLWIAEGLFFYLIEADVRRILQQAAELTRAGGKFFADTMGTGLLTRPVMGTYLAFLKSQDMPMPFCTDDPSDLMKASGWEIDVARL